MPAYNLLNPPPVLSPGDERYLWGTSVAAGVSPTPGQQQAPTDANVVGETLVVGVKSQQVTLTPVPGRVAGAMVQIVFSGNPGAFEVDVEEAAVDDTNKYILNATSAAYKIVAATAMADGKYVAWAELQPQGGRFLRLGLVALANVVTVTGKVIYL